MQVTLVRPYDPVWPEWFEVLRAWLEPVLREVPHTVEHVGGTAIPGMTAKPLIDLDIVIDRGDFPRVREALGRLGYQHQGDKGLRDREAFGRVPAEAKPSLPAHHLYVCMEGAPELRKHLLFRDFLRSHPEWVQRLSAHKVDLCKRYANDRQAYIDGKSEMVRQITALAFREASRCHGE